MKKTLTMTILLITLTLALCVPFPCAIAEGESYYVANDDVTIYAFNEMTSALEPAFTVPKTYYFVLQAEELGAKRAVTYNGAKFYVDKSVINDGASTTGASPYVGEVEGPFYSLGTLAVASDKTTVNVYMTSVLSSAEGDFEVIPNSRAIDSFYGIFQKDDATYFYVSLKIGGTARNVYIAAADTDKPDATLAAVTPHPNSVAPPVDDPDKDDVPTIGNGDDVNPDVQKPENHMLRNILIAVICVLSVVVVFLIFKPKSRKKSRRGGKGRYYDDDDDY